MMMTLLSRASVCALSLLAVLACEPQEASTSPDRAVEATQDATQEATQDATQDATDATAQRGAASEEKHNIDNALGGQLYDKWYAVRGYNTGFKPDSKKTEELDGEAGPNGNGTLNNGGGQVMANPGHDFRLKNLFGWDLRGAEGIYGPEYHNKKHVLPINLLTDTRSREELMSWLSEGDDQLPAFGEEWTPARVEATAAFIVAVREGELPQPDQIWTLSKEAPKNYVLNAGADAARGAKLFASKCSGCHGDKGDTLMIDDDYTLGAFGRMKAYEGWFKVINGQPGSPMSRQSHDAQEVLDIFAALCDRAAFPPKDAEHEVADGDLRCGAYLK